MMPYDAETERPLSNAFSAGLNKLVAQALADKSLLWVGLSGAIGIWGFAVYRPDLWTLIAAGGYSVSVFIPLLFKKG